jgi:hypothetical protein
MTIAMLLRNTLKAAGATPVEQPSAGAGRVRSG